MFRLYSNENFPKSVVEELRRLGHDVLTVLEAGKADQSVPDEDVVVCSFDRDFVGLAKRIDEAMTTCGDLHSQLLRVNRIA